MNPSSVDELMNLAIEKAEKGIGDGQTPFGAVIARKCPEGGYEVVSAKHNRVFAKTDITAHAEINAIRAACKKLDRIKLTDCIIVSTTEPCPMCFCAIHWAGIKKVYFGTGIEDAKKAKFNELTISNDDMKRLGKSPVEIEGGVLKKENIRVFQKWSTSHGKKTY